jgi:hypothetical protein
MYVVETRCRQGASAAECIIAAAAPWCLEGRSGSLFTRPVFVLVWHS